LYSAANAAPFNPGFLTSKAIFGADRARMGYGGAVIYVFPIYEGTTAAWGLTPLEDQQLGGLVM
jgi:hypothetical protein